MPRAGANTLELRRTLSVEVESILRLRLHLSTNRHSARSDQPQSSVNRYTHQISRGHSHRCQIEFPFDMRQHSQMYIHHIEHMPLIHRRGLEERVSDCSIRYVAHGNDGDPYFHTMVRTVLTAIRVRPI